jgi:hypothetical protein
MKTSAAILSLLLLATAPIAAADTGDLGARAMQLVEQLRDGDFDAPHAAFDDTMRRALPPEQLRQTWAGITGQAGALLSLKAAGETAHQGYRIQHVACGFERMDLIADVVFDGAGRVAGLFFKPAPADTDEP